MVSTAERSVAWLAASRDSIAARVARSGRAGGAARRRRHDCTGRQQDGEAVVGVGRQGGCGGVADDEVEAVFGQAVEAVDAFDAVDLGDQEKLPNTGAAGAR